MRFQDNFFDVEFNTMATIILKNLDFISQDSNAKIILYLTIIIIINKNSFIIIHTKLVIHFCDFFYKNNL